MKIIIFSYYSSASNLDIEERLDPTMPIDSALIMVGQCWTRHTGAQLRCVSIECRPIDTLTVLQPQTKG